MPFSSRTRTTGSVKEFNGEEHRFGGLMLLSGSMRRGDLGGSSEVFGKPGTELTARPFPWMLGDAQHEWHVLHFPLSLF